MLSLHWYFWRAELSTVAITSACLQEGSLGFTQTYHLPPSFPIRSSQHSSLSRWTLNIYVLTWFLGFPLLDKKLCECRVLSTLFTAVFLMPRKGLSPSRCSGDIFGWMNEQIYEWLVAREGNIQFWSSEPSTPWIPDFDLRPTVQYWVINDLP